MRYMLRMTGVNDRAAYDKLSEEIKVNFPNVAIVYSSLVGVCIETDDAPVLEQIKNRFNVVVFRDIPIGEFNPPK